MAQVEIFHERDRRRWTEGDKRRLVAETLAPGATVHGVARRHGVNTSQLFTWRKQLRLELGPAAAPVPGFAAVAITPVVSSASEVTPPGLIEIELADGARVRISGAADPALVKAMLRTLQPSTWTSSPRQSRQCRG
jgi:transposase